MVPIAEMRTQRKVPQTTTTYSVPSNRRTATLIALHQVETHCLPTTLLQAVFRTIEPRRFDRDRDYREPSETDDRVASSNLARESSAVTTASASVLVPNPVRYDGPGVVIRLPKDAAARCQLSDRRCRDQFDSSGRIANILIQRTVTLFGILARSHFYWQNRLVNLATPMFEGSIDSS